MHSSLMLMGIKPWIHHLRIKWASPDEDAEPAAVVNARKEGWTCTPEGDLKFLFWKRTVTSNTGWQCFFYFIHFTPGEKETSLLGTTILCLPDFFIVVWSHGDLIWTLLFWVHWDPLSLLLDHWDRGEVSCEANWRECLCHLGPRKGHSVLVESGLGKESMSLPWNQLVRGHVSARRPVDSLVGERMLPQLGLHAIGAQIQLGWGHTSAVWGLVQFGT